MERKREAGGGREEARGNRHSLIILCAAFVCEAQQPFWSAALFVCCKKVKIEN